MNYEKIKMVLIFIQTRDKIYVGEFETFLTEGVKPEKTKLKEKKEK